MKLGITLSGGGIRCVAHLAIVQALEEEGIVPEVYSGTSGGALLSALLGTGLSPVEIMDLLRKTNLFFSIKPAFTLSGFLDIKKALSFALSYLPETFEELKYSVSVGATNVKTGESSYFSSGPLAPAILASCCMPVIFKPVEINGEFYVDGGVLNNMPVEPIRDKCEKLIGVNSNPVSKDFELTNVKSLLERTFLLTINANVAQRKPLCDVYLEPDCLKGYKVFDFRKADEIFERTAGWMKENLPLMKNQLL